MGKVNMAICTKNRFQFFQKLYILHKSSRLARGREAQNYGGCPRMEDTLSIDIFVKFDFPIPELGIRDASTPERIIGIIAEDYVSFTGLGIADMKFIHTYSPSIIS
jgi:hypothetical protein